MQHVDRVRLQTQHPVDGRRVDVRLNGAAADPFQLVPLLDQVVEHVALLGEVLRRVAREVVLGVGVRLVADSLWEFQLLLTLNH